MLQELEAVRDELAALRGDNGKPAAMTAACVPEVGQQPDLVNPIRQLARGSVAAIEMANIILTRDEAAVGTSPCDVVWTHRKTTLYRYRSSQRRHAVPLLLVFALINRPEIFDLRPGSSLIEFLLDEGFDVFLVDWGSRRRGRRHGARLLHLR